MKNDQGDEELAQVERYQEVLEESRDQKRTIDVLKAKVSALQNELTESIKKINLLEIQVEDHGDKKKKEVQDAKKLEN